VSTKLINFVDLRSKLRSYHAHTQEPLGIYFEYLPSGVSIGIDEKQTFVLASLLKVPMVMGVYKHMENHEITRDTVLTVEQSDIDPFFGDLWKRGLGVKLTVDELIKLSLIDSDNTAQKLLFRTSPALTIENVFDSLDIPKERNDDLPVVSPKNYSSILRSLYLSSYLSREHSNEILDILTRTKFNDKLPAQLPPNIKVAHKIGVHLDKNSSASIYTDCGIVYVPKRPYILCIMVKSDEKTATKDISEISKIVFDYVNTRDVPKK
jgi:beta-lactamase class A